MVCDHGGAARPWDHGVPAGRDVATLDAPAPLPVPVAPYDLPHYATPRVQRDHHVEAPRPSTRCWAMIGRHLDAQADLLGAGQ